MDRDLLKKLGIGLATFNIIVSAITIGINYHDLKKDKTSEQTYQKRKK